MQANVLIHLSNIIIPAFIFYVIATGLSLKKDIYSSFTKGAAQGFKTVVGIIPTLIGLMVAVGVLRDSGFLDLPEKILGHLLERFPEELLSLFFVKLFSASAATGFALDIFKEHGTDSFAGMAASLALSSTETVFYTMSVYFLSVKVTKTRWTLTGALLSTVAGIIASVFLAQLLTS